MPDPIIIEDDGSHYPITLAGKESAEVNRVAPGDAPLAIVCTGNNNYNLGRFDPEEPYDETVDTPLRVSIKVGTNYVLQDYPFSAVDVEFTKNKKAGPRIHVSLIAQTANPPRYKYVFTTAVTFDEKKGRDGENIYATSGLFSSKNCRITAVYVPGQSSSPYTDFGANGVQVHIY